MRKPIVFTSEREMPPMAVSLADMGHNRTGSWRYMRPIYSEKIAPCKNTCPLGNDIPRILSLVSEGRYEEAWRLFRQTSPLPGVCGRVCYHPCETKCNRKDFDEALSIASIERFVADACFDLEDKVSERPRRSEKIAIVGSGPAGLTCAYFLAKDGYAVTVFEAASQPGGMLRLGIPPYRLPREVLNREIELIARWGVEFRTNTKIGQDIDIEKLWEQYDALFIATGAHRSRALNIPGEELALTGLEFLKAVNAGQTVHIGKRVLIIGGGNTAMDCARTAQRLGAEVTVYYRRTAQEMPAIREEIDEAILEGVRFEFQTNPISVRARDGRVCGLELIRMQQGPLERDGRRRPVPIPDSEFSVEVDTVILAIGERADLEFLRGSGLQFAEKIRTTFMGVTSLPGVFACGDVAFGYGTVTQSIATGRRVAEAVARYLHQRSAKR